MYGAISSLSRSRNFKCNFNFDSNIQSDNSFPDNSVSTGKYTLLTFIPKCLLEQFRRVGNLYFLLISVLMLIGTYSSLFDSPLTPWSTLLTLIIVLSISMGKEAVEDLKRHRADNITNKQDAIRLDNNGKEHNVVWKDIRVSLIFNIRNLLLLGRRCYSCK